MLAQSSELDALKVIRLALEQEEQQIRVNDSTTNETYDLTLSRSAPYASPIVSRTTTPIGSALRDRDSSLPPSPPAPTGHRILRLPQLVSKRNGSITTNPSAFSQVSPTTSNPSQKPLPQPSPNGLYDLTHREALHPQQHKQQNQYTAPTRLHPLVGELPPSPPLEADLEQQHRGAVESFHQNAQDGRMLHRLAEGEPVTGEEELAPPAIPAKDEKATRVPAPRRALTADFAASLSANAPSDVGVPLTSEPLQDFSQALPGRLPLGGERPPGRTHTPRGFSESSTASTSYQTASSHDDAADEDDTATISGQTPQDSASRPSLPNPAPAIRLTHDATPYLHPSNPAVESSSGNTEAGPSSLAPRGPHVTNAVTGRQAPPRRNTTGSTLQGRRPPSASSLSQRSGMSTRDREHFGVVTSTSNQNFYSPEREIHSSTDAAALRTGDAAFDEEAAKHAEQLRRDKRAKEQKARDAAEQEGAVAGAEIGSSSGAGTGIAALARSKTGTNWTRKEKEEAHEEPKVLVGNLIGEGHANYVLMYNMLTGIRIGVSRCQAKMKRPLTDADYTAKHKFTFDIIGNELTPSAKYDFKFKDYAPWVFRELREYFHLDPADYLLSLTAKYILSELGSPGKSGSFFYFSRDYRFIIKTIHHREHKFLRKILKDYHEHIKTNPHTLLSRFYGLHRVKLPHGRKIHFVVMNNLFPPHRDIHETYDLKGSSIGREYPEEIAKTKKGAVLKDLNWLGRGRELELGPEKRSLFEAQLKSDVELLKRLNIMDYSLLIGLHDMRRGNKENLRQDALQVFQPETPSIKRQPTQIKRNSEKDAFALRAAVRRSDPKALSSQTTKLPDKDVSERRYFYFYQDEGGFRSTDEENRPGHMIYYLGIIDLFTPYTNVKRGEHFWRGLTNDSHCISAVPPKEYGERFVNFLSSIIKGGDKTKRPKMIIPKSSSAYVNSEGKGEK
ncbi:SAICAR synthase-like protein [Violaceomyces palustris]|uniref:SAICAR synthase-like protein n=1 Tax=Violaceomyces palustris TaxID=1673888 RepID=A0ACD0P134_9BASI|nr:SAICAR synthase-like protein [Violaceomyces palustris]